MIQKAEAHHVGDIVKIYDKILDLEELNKGCTGWIRGIYPVQETAKKGLNNQDLYVMEENGKIVAAARINQEQVAEYAEVNWRDTAAPNQVMVLHTLVVDPDCGGLGYATEFVKFYENLARENDCPYLRIDTNEKNMPARRLYKKLGYVEAGIVPCDFNGIPHVFLVGLEKRSGGEKR